MYINNKEVKPPGYSFALSTYLTSQYLGLYSQGPNQAY